MRRRGASTAAAPAHHQQTMNIDILSAADAAALESKIRDAECIVLVAHARPDGDALCSCLAWATYLEEHYGKQSHIVMPNAFPDFLHWVPGSQVVRRHDKHTDEVRALVDRCDLLFCLDHNNMARTEDLGLLLDTCKATRVVIDHHIDPVMRADIMVSQPELSSTCEVVFRMVWQLGGYDELSRKFAVQVYTGMMTDTGGFTYNSSSPEIYFIICQLLTKGFDKDKVYRNVFNNYSQWAIRLRGYLMSQRLCVMGDLHASYFTLTRQDMRRFHFVRGDVEGLVNEPLRIKGLKCSISLREDDRVDNRVWVSLRSVDDFSVEDMARRFFNGGGHFNASGGHLDCSIEEAVEIAKQAINSYADKLKA